MKILIIVDMQNDFIDGALGTKEAQAIVPKVAKLIEESAAEDTLILFTKDTHAKDYMNTLEGKNLPVSHCIKDDYGWELNPVIWYSYEKVKDKYYNVPEFSYYLFTKHHIVEKPTFGSLDLQNILITLDDESVHTKNDIESITLVGLCTGICVLSNAILCKATLPEVPVNVIADCCACVTPESHQTALDAMKLCQINII